MKGKEKKRGKGGERNEEIEKKGRKAYGEPTARRVRRGGGGRRERREG